MPARTGKEYLDGLKAQSSEIWLDGKRIHDVTAFPGLANGAKSIASLYDMQHDPGYRQPDDLRLADDGRPGGTVILGAEKRRRLGTASHHDVQLGARQLWDDGPHTRFPERNHHGNGRRRPIFRRQPA